MSRKEVPRAGLLKAALVGRLTNTQGARALGLSVRQFRRLKRRFREGAPAACSTPCAGGPVTDGWPLRPGSRSACS